MKHRLISLCFAAFSMLALPAMLFAQDDEDKRINARLVNYPSAVKVDDASTTLLWLLLIVIAIICVGALFKQAKRTHLD